jgi:hypothetical protein
METTTGTANHIFDLGTFEGFNFKESAPIQRRLTADEVSEWDHDLAGEAEFWPAGDNLGVFLVFQDQSAVTAEELSHLKRLLNELGGDSVENFLKLYYVKRGLGWDIGSTTGQAVEDLNIHIFQGENFGDARREAAFELFEIFYPDAYRAWRESSCDGLIFDPERFLNSPIWSVTEARIGDSRAVIIGEV